MTRSQSGRSHDNSQKSETFTKYQAYRILKRSLFIATEENRKDVTNALSANPIDKERLPLMPLSNAKTVLSFIEFIVQKALSLMNQRGQNEYEIIIDEAVIKLSSDEHRAVAEVKQQPSSDKD